MKMALAHTPSMLPQMRFSVINKPLFNMELDHVILDELDLMMRITDRLTENLMTKVVERTVRQIFQREKERKNVYTWRPSLIWLLLEIDKMRLMDCDAPGVTQCRSVKLCPTTFNNKCLYSQINCPCV